MNGCRDAWIPAEVEVPDEPVQWLEDQRVWIAISMGARCWDYSRIGPREATGAEFVVTTSMD